MPRMEHQEVFLEDSGQWDIKSWLMEVRVTQILHSLPNKQSSLFCQESRFPSPLIQQCITVVTNISEGFPGGLDGKKPACNAGDPDLIPGSGRSPGEGNGNSL